MQTQVEIRFGNESTFMRVEQIRVVKAMGSYRLEFPIAHRSTWLAQSASVPDPEWAEALMTGSIAGARWR